MHFVVRLVAFWSKKKKKKKKKGTSDKKKTFIVFS